MHVIEQQRPTATPIPGLDHATWAGRDEGLQQLSLWRQTLQPGVSTPPHSHDCDEVVLCVAGCGELEIDGEVQRFGADATVVLPRGRAHRIVNPGPRPLELLGVFGSSPVGTFGPDGAVIALPWRS